MNPMTKDTRNVVARVMAESFMEDPMNQLNLTGVKRKEELLLAHSMLHVKHAERSGNLFLLDGDPRAFLIGSDSLSVSRTRDMLLNWRIVSTTLWMLDAADRKTVLSNYKKTRHALSFTWQNDFINGRFYRLKIIAIDREMRGTGAFRRLITPRIEFADAASIPMILETHNPQNVGLYEHFQFKLARTITCDVAGLTQYCMIRHPENGTAG